MNFQQITRITNIAHYLVKNKKIGPKDKTLHFYCTFKFALPFWVTIIVQGVTVKYFLDDRYSP